MEEHTSKVGELDSVDEDRVRAMFKNRGIFISGGTGFLGKVLIEKCLRCCPEIKKLYLLIRAKKGKESRERLRHMFSDPLFDKLKETRGLDTIVDQCYVVSGDCLLPDLGISDDDRQLLAREVSLVYHCAATVRFDESLKRSVLLNARCTQLMLELSKTFKNLDLFCHVSTAYCQINESLLLEKPYPPPINPHIVIKTVEELTEDDLNALMKKILGDFPNTYAFSKCLAEALVVEQMTEMPAFIVRPSIVIPTRYEPIRGWTDNLNGPTGLLIGAGKGVLRTMYCNSSGYGDYIPVDFAANGLLLTAWNFVANKDHARRVYHFVSSAEIQVSWKELIDRGRWTTCNRLPMNWVLWYPGGSIKNSRLKHNICFYLYQVLPALLIDSLLFCLCIPPVLCRVQRRIQQGFDIFEYYTNNQWSFDNKSVIYMRTIVNDIEKQRYPLQDDNIDIIEYMEDCILAARRFILKEKDHTIPTAKRHMKIMFYVQKVCKLLIVGFFIYYLYGIVCAYIPPIDFTNSIKAFDTKSA